MQKLDAINSESILESINIVKNINKILKNQNISEGKSNEFFFQTFDKKLIIKSISKESFKM